MSSFGTHTQILLLYYKKIITFSVGILFPDSRAPLLCFVFSKLLLCDHLGQGTGSRWFIVRDWRGIRVNSHCVSGNNLLPSWIRVFLSIYTLYSEQQGGQGPQLMALSRCRIYSAENCSPRGNLFGIGQGELTRQDTRDVVAYG